MPGCLPLARPSCSWPALVLSVSVIAAPLGELNSDRLSLLLASSLDLPFRIQHGVRPHLNTLEQPHDHVCAFHRRHFRVVFHFYSAFNHKVAVVKAVYLAVGSHPTKLPLGLTILAVADEQPALAARDLHAAGRQEGQHTASFALHLFHPSFTGIGTAFQRKPGPFTVDKLHAIALSFRRYCVHHHKLPV